MLYVSSETVNSAILPAQSLCCARAQMHEVEQTHKIKKSRTKTSCVLLSTYAGAWLALLVSVLSPVEKYL